MFTQRGSSSFGSPPVGRIQPIDREFFYLELKCGSSSFGSPPVGRIQAIDREFFYLELKCGSSSFGRAIAFQAIGGEFEPRLPLFKNW
jgi:hypothetical protein